MLDEIATFFGKAGICRKQGQVHMNFDSYRNETHRALKTALNSETLT
jgi:hypothetical protein